jgi:cell division protein ZapB
MPMTDKDTQSTAEMDLRALEIRVEELIRACSYLKDENKSLRVRQDNLVTERAILIEKTELARTRVEAMITRLKSMETPQ